MWDAFKDLIFWAIQSAAQFTHDWGLGILFITVLIRLCLFPLVQKQYKANFSLQKVQPLLQEVQQKYSDDPVRLQEETQKIYAETKFNPLAGCLPLLIQMPIFIALYQVLQEISWRAAGQEVRFFNIVPNLIVSPSHVFTEYGVMPAIPYVVLMLIFAFCTFLPSLLSPTANPQQQKQMRMMMIFMSIFMLWIGWNAPAGVLLFWGISSVWAICQQQITQRKLKAEEARKEDELEVKPVVVDVERKVRKKRPTKNH